MTACHLVHMTLCHLVWVDFGRGTHQLEGRVAKPAIGEPLARACEPAGAFRFVELADHRPDGQAAVHCEAFHAREAPRIAVGVVEQGPQDVPGAGR